MKQRQNVLIILFVIVIMAVYSVYEVNKPQPIDWSRNFSVDKKSPYGTYILKDALPYLFPEGSVRVSRNSVRERLRMGDCRFPETYFFVGMFFKIDQGDFATLLEEVENGNSLFVSADFIPDTLFSIVGIEEGKRIAQGKDYLRGFEDKAYSFASNHTSFRLRDSFNGEVLGYVNQVENPNFVKVPYGEGVIYLHANPMGFTNFYLLDSVAGDYYQKVLSFLPADENVVWDEYLKSGTGGQHTLFQVILRYPALKWAYVLMMLGGLLYLLFRSKREQRPIPVIRPLENRTLEFVSVVSSLYYKQKDHFAIANKRINSFLEEVRYYYKLRTEELDRGFIDLLSERSGVGRESVENLVNLIVRVRKAEHVNEEQLRELVKYIELFKTKS